MTLMMIVDFNVNVLVMVAELPLVVSAPYECPSPTHRRRELSNSTAIAEQTLKSKR